ncbi:MAG: aminotransferase class V-fold PLP-dependent enzyme [Candidatus Micrarchaeota archaeon]
MNPKPPLSRRFIDVPKIVSEGRTREFFPRLLPNIETIRGTDFPLFGANGRVYLDSGATSQEPKTVMERMMNYRTSTIRGSNHSKMSVEARRAQEEYENAKSKLRRFFEANNYHIVFTSGTTGSSNLLATRFAYDRDTVVLMTGAEHNSQIVTARNFASASGVRYGYVPVSLDGRMDIDKLRYVTRQHTGTILLNLVHVSNVTGVVNDVEMIRKAVGDRVFIYLDMAQSAGHIPIDLDSLGVDFAGVSAHKMYGPTGIGAFFVSERGERHLTNLVSGGSAVNLVSENVIAYANSPERFEPGTQNIEGAIEWGYALDYLSYIGMVKIAAHDEELGEYFGQELAKIGGLILHSPNTTEGRVPIFVFNMRSLHYTDLAKELDDRGISVRDGCFCAHLLMSRLLGKPPEVMDLMASLFAATGGDPSMLPGAVRASFAFYNNLQDAHKAVMTINAIAERYW